MADIFPKSNAQPAARAVAYVCRKCGETADELRSGLKRTAKHELPKKTLRVVLTDCQGVCPKKAAFMTLVAPGAATVFRIVQPDEVDEVVAEVIGSLK